MNNYYYNDEQNNRNSTRPIVFIFVTTLLIIGVIVFIVCACNGVGIFSCAKKESDVTIEYRQTSPQYESQPVIVGNGGYIQGTPVPSYANDPSGNYSYDRIYPQYGEQPADPYYGTADTYGYDDTGYYQPAGETDDQQEWYAGQNGWQYEEDGPGDDWWYTEEMYQQDQYGQDDVWQDNVWCEETPAPTADPDRVLKFGAKGDDVAVLQQRLIDLGYLEGYADGDFGSKTQTAVKWFQRQAGLTADGAAGKKTKEVLYSDNAPYARVTSVTAGDIPLIINKQMPVDESFVPQDLVYLEDYMPTGLCMFKIKNLQGVREAVDALIDMLQAARADGQFDWQISEAYRTWDRQKQIFDNKVSEFMNNNKMSRSQAVSATRQTVADPGTSEHHSGLAFDITIPGKIFSDTKQYRWMKEHCWEYGFILRYTDEKQKITGFLGEEWHFRYVGREHALCMRDMDMCLEEYVAYLNSR